MPFSFANFMSFNTDFTTVSASLPLIVTGCPNITSLVIWITCSLLSAMFLFCCFELEFTPEGFVNNVEVTASGFNHFNW